jgi:hypothetical protein
VTSGWEGELGAMHMYDLIYIWDYLLNAQYRLPDNSDILLTFRFTIVLLFLGELLPRKTSDHLDMASFVVGTITLLKQFHSDNTDHFLEYLAQYVRSVIESAQK